MVKERTIVIKDVFRRGDNKIKDFNGYHAIAYTGMQLMYVPFFESAITSVNGICEMVNITNRNTKKNIKEAIEDLIRWELIEVDVDEIKNGNQFSAKIPNMSTERFTTINNQFVWNIISSDYSVQETGNMLLVYMVLAQYMGNDIVAFPNMETIAKDINLSRSTVSNMLKHLKHLGIIDYDNSNTYNGYLVGNIYVFCDTSGYEDILKSETSKLTSAEFNKDKWLSINCSLYIVRLYNERENFYKIGVTTNVSRRMGQIPYEYEIIKIIDTNMYEAYYLENELHQKYKQYRYFPAKDFDGKTECFHYIY